MDDTNIPAVLKAEAQWVCWRTEVRNGTPTKVLLDPATGDYAKTDTPATWHAYETAFAAYRRDDNVDGTGVVFREDGPYAGVDLDGCRDSTTGDVEDWAVEILRRLESYTEVSPSGTGFHVYVIGEIPAGGNRAGQLEMYDRDRYFTVTGDRVPGVPQTVEERSGELRAIHKEYLVAGADNPAADPVPTAQRPDVDLPDDELLERARNASNGDRFEQLYDRGDTSRDPSYSEADLDLANILSFWTGGDAQRIERLFNRSALVRDKWRDRPDYRERTIRTAIEGCPAF